MMLYSYFLMYALRYGEGSYVACAVLHAITYLRLWPAEMLDVATGGTVENPYPKMASYLHDLIQCTGQY